MRPQVPGVRGQVSGKRAVYFVFSYNLKPKTSNLSQGFTPTPIGAWLSRCAVRAIARLRQAKSLARIGTSSTPSAQLCPNRCRGFTLIETLVAITLLTVAIVSPMSLVTKSLSTAYYARDQVTVFHLAQEAIEIVRRVRDNNILKNALGTDTDLLKDIPSGGEAFTVDARDDSMVRCPPEDGCPVLKTNGTFYGYGTGVEWVPSRFTRTVRAEFIDGGLDEVYVSVEVSWQTGSFKVPKSIIISENLYRWIDDGSTI